jgi:hypothetical protein
MKHDVIGHSGPELPARLVESCIYELHGTRVMLDRDLARLYGVETRVLNQTVKRNLSRFPPDFMFSLTREEIARMSQIVISPDLRSRADLRYDVQFKVVFDALRQLMQRPKPEPEHRKIGFQVREPFVAPYRAPGRRSRGRGQN